MNWNETTFYSWAGLRLIEADGGAPRVELNVQDHRRSGGGWHTSVNGGTRSYMFDGLLGAAVAPTWDEGVLGQVTVT